MTARAAEMTPAVASRDKLLVLSRGQSSALVFLLFAHFWLANSSFKAAQVAAELLIALWMIAYLIPARFTFWEAATAVTFFGAMGLALLSNPVGVIMLDAKVVGLGLLTILFFKRVRVQDSLSAKICVLNIVVMLYTYYIAKPEWYRYVVVNYGRMFASYVDLGRPLGLFMNPHVSAFISGIFLLYVGYRKLWYNIPFAVIIYIHGITYVLLSFVGALFNRLLAWLRLDRWAYVALVVAIPLVFINASAVLGLNLAQYSLGGARVQYSFMYIAEQLVSPAAYASAFTLLPSDPIGLAAHFINIVGNEVGYFALMQTAGAILGAMYLWMLFPEIRGFRVFLAVALFHYGIATTPFAVYLMMHFSQKLAPRWADEDAESAARRVKAAPRADAGAALRPAGQPS